MIRLMLYTFLVTMVVLSWPIVAVLAGVYLLWRHYPRGA
jgi:hypothetical protein